MHTLADKENVSDLHIPQVCFSGDVLLQPGTERSAQKISECREEDGNGNQPDTPKGGFGSSKRRPGKGRRENRRGNEVGTTTRMDGKLAFARLESSHRFGCRGRYIFKLNIAKQEKACWVGMSSHGGSIFVRKHVKRGMFERMVSSCFENEGKVEDHMTIIHATGDVCHAINGRYLN